MQVNVLEAKNRLSELLRAVQRGEEVVIANRGKGLARLAPLPTTAVAEPAPPGQAAAFADWLARNPWPRRGPGVHPSDAERHTDIQQRIEELRSAWD
jgi:prevent-host-death family protein